MENGITKDEENSIVDFIKECVKLNLHIVSIELPTSKKIDFEEWRKINNYKAINTRYFSKGDTIISLGKLYLMYRQELKVKR